MKNNHGNPYHKLVVEPTPLKNITVVKMGKNFPKVWGENT